MIQLFGLLWKDVISYTKVSIIPYFLTSDMVVNIMYKFSKVQYRSTKFLLALCKTG